MIVCTFLPLFHFFFQFLFICMHLLALTCDGIPHRFTEERSSFEYGQVNHALTAAMRTLMKEYLILVTQLEHLHRQGLLSLQKLWFYIQPTMRTMEILASIGECCVCHDT